MSFYDARGRSNYFIEFGEGRPIVLLHGISFKQQSEADPTFPRSSVENNNQTLLRRKFNSLETLPCVKRGCQRLMLPERSR